MGVMEGKIIVHHPIIAGLTRYNPLWADSKPLPKCLSALINIYLLFIKYVYSYSEFIMARCWGLIFNYMKLKIFKIRFSKICLFIVCQAWEFIHSLRVSSRPTRWQK